MSNRRYEQAMDLLHSTVTGNQKTRLKLEQATPCMKLSSLNAILSDVAILILKGFGKFPVSLLRLGLVILRRLSKHLDDLSLFLVQKPL